MARRLRIQFPGAIYHVINRGNYRRDVFDSTGAAEAFVRVLDEACRRYRWRVHAYALMRNHYHLALETPEANLVDGMHWLQSTYATRFNRFRTERGHLFEGRYRALLIEDAAALGRVVDYVHLNPVRAGIVAPEQMAGFRWGSLIRFVRPGRPEWLVASAWLAQSGLDDDREGWRKYTDRLMVRAREPLSEAEENELCKGWAIGTEGWRRALAASYERLAIHQGITANEIREIKQARWSRALERLLQESGKSLSMARSEPKGAAWKKAIAGKLGREVGASHRWMAEVLCMGSPNSVRSYLSRARRILSENQQLSA